MIELLDAGSRRDLVVGELLGDVGVFAVEQVILIKAGFDLPLIDGPAHPQGLGGGEQGLGLLAQRRNGLGPDEAVEIAPTVLGHAVLTVFEEGRALGRLQRADGITVGIDQRQRRIVSGVDRHHRNLPRTPAHPRAQSLY